MKYSYSIIFVLVLLLSSSSSASDRPEIKPYCHAGALAGYETDIPGYDESRYRVLYDLGIKWINPPIGFLKQLKSIGISWNIAFGTSEWEVRHGIGPKLTWALNDKWSLESMAGPAFSKPAENFATGYHLSGGILYKGIVSFDLSYERLPVLDDYHNRTGEFIESIYGGISIHGKAGAYVSLASAVIFTVAGIIIMNAVSEGLSGLN